MSNATHWPRLLSCPFCGGRASARLVNDKDYWRVSCDAALTCGHSGPALPALDTAAESWNRRVAVAPGEVAEPPIYWRCFHCDFIARDKAAALEHFGPGISERPPLCQPQT